MLLDNVSIPEGKLLLSKIETARILEMSVRSLDKVTFPNGSLMPVRVTDGGKVRFSRDAITRWISQQEQAPSVDLRAESLSSDSVHQ